MVLASALLHASWSVSIKGSSDPLGFNLLQSWVGLAMLAAITPFVDFAEVPQAVWRLLVAAGISHGLYMYWMSRAYELGDRRLVYVIGRSTPALLPLVAVPLFGASLIPGGTDGIALLEEIRVRRRRDEIPKLIEDSEPDIAGTDRAGLRVALDTVHARVGSPQPG